MPITKRTEKLSFMDVTLVKISLENRVSTIDPEKGNIRLQFFFEAAM